MQAILEGKINGVNTSIKTHFVDSPMEGEDIEIAYWEGGKPRYINTKIKRIIWVNGLSPRISRVDFSQYEYYPLIEFGSVQSSHSMVWHLFNWILKKIN